MTRAIRALVDGLSVETIPIDDRGLQYGHGMFETCRVLDGMIPEVAQIVASQSDGVLKVLVTAGLGGRGAMVHLCQTRLAPQPLLAGLKHLNRLEQVLARAEFEGTATNVFLVRSGRIVTPRLRPGRIGQSIIDALEVRFGFPRSQ